MLPLLLKPFGAISVVFIVGCGRVFVDVELMSLMCEDGVRTERMVGAPAVFLHFVRFFREGVAHYAFLRGKVASGGDF